MLKKTYTKLFFILLLGLIVRIVFTYFIAEYYFGRTNIYVDGDTSAWSAAFENLYEHGSYSVDLSKEYGYFGRLPGYSFLLGIFWLVIKDWNLVYPAIALFQILLDVFSIFLVFRISFKLFQNLKITYYTAILYALYPFIIIWNPVAYSESSAIFLMILAVYFLVHYEKKRNIALSGLILGLSVLFRPQLIFLLPGFILYLFSNKIDLREKIKNTVIVLILFVAGYGVWPLRNYLNHDKVILTQDLRGFNNWDVDVISFMQYIYSVKGEWEPQFSSIVQNKPVEFPHASYSIPGDSIKLFKAVRFCKTCGKGFSYWPGYWKEKVSPDSSCSDEIALIFDELRENQIKNNPVNFWIYVPLQNLKKALFKTTLTNNEGFIRKAASFLFYYRSLLILSGIFGLILLFKQNRPVFLLFCSFFLILYLYLCFGTGPQVRNIEIRYFLPADIVLLFPAVYGFFFLVQKISLKKKKMS